MPGERIQHIITLLSFKLDILPQVRCFKYLKSRYYFLRTCFITLHPPVRDSRGRICRIKDNRKIIHFNLLVQTEFGFILKVILIIDQKMSQGKLKQFRRSLTLLTFNLKEVYKDTFKAKIIFKILQAAKFSKKKQIPFPKYLEHKLIL